MNVSNVAGRRSKAASYSPKRQLVYVIGALVWVCALVKKRAAEDGARNDALCIGAYFSWGKSVAFVFLKHLVCCRVSRRLTDGTLLFEWVSVCAWQWVFICTQCNILAGILCVRTPQVCACIQYLHHAKFEKLKRQRHARISCAPTLSVNILESWPYEMLYTMDGTESLAVRLWCGVVCCRHNAPYTMPKTFFFFSTRARPKFHEESSVAFNYVHKLDFEYTARCASTINMMHYLHCGW